MASEQGRWHNSEFGPFRSVEGVAGAYVDVDADYLNGLEAENRRLNGHIADLEAGIRHLKEERDEAREALAELGRQLAQAQARAELADWLVADDENAHDAAVILPAFREFLRRYHDLSQPTEEVKG